jgi:lipopolysaccharide biosynthesis regulator YciM
MSKAVDVLVELLRAEDNQTKIRAAENVIEYAVKLNHNEELEKRINDLKEWLKESQSSSWQSY